ncbi:MAG: hypothetical protein WA183_17580 [Chthoniobacterales bacterium]
MRTRLLLSMFAAACFTACATGYHSSGFTGGFSDTQLAPDVFRISFQGNGYTSVDRTQDLALLRAADVTLSHGYHYFGVMNEAEGGHTDSFTTPGQSYTSAAVTGYGNTAYGSATTTYIPPQRFSFFKPRSGLMIRCFAERPEGGFAFDAAFLSRSLRAKYRIKD